MRTENTKTQTEIMEIFNLYRGMILDGMELEIEDANQWKKVRSRLLKLLGDRGLEGRIINTLKNGWDHHDNDNNS